MLSTFYHEDEVNEGGDLDLDDVELVPEVTQEVPVGLRLKVAPVRVLLHEGLDALLRHVEHHAVRLVHVTASDAACLRVQIHLDVEMNTC